jgi:hypothetical protein
MSIILKEHIFKEWMKQRKQLPVRKVSKPVRSILQYKVIKLDKEVLQVYIQSLKIAPPDFKSNNAALQTL